MNRAERRANGVAPGRKVLAGFIHRAVGGWPQHARSWRMLQARDTTLTHYLIGELDQESSANISQGRCDIVAAFLADQRQPDWLFLLDDDMTFADDLLERLMASADRQDRPIVGGLCFGTRPFKDEDGREIVNRVYASPLELFPTIYILQDDGKMGHVFGYPEDTVVRVASTGAACLLIHRRVLEDERWRMDGHPLPWFRESVLHGHVCSEDQFFCLKAGSLGYPIHVDTAAKTGHVKTFVADETLYLAQRALVEEVADDRHPDPDPVAS